MKSFQNKNIWIIGASSGIGAALAQNLAKQGARIILSARREDELNDVASTMEGNPIVLTADVTDHKDLTKKAKKLKKDLGTLDSIILLAGMYDPSLVKDMNLEKAHQTIDVNLKGTLNLIHAVLPILKAQKYGQLALTASVAGYRGLPKGQPYSATKAAMINLTESLRAEEKELDIRLISPGFVKTPMTAKNDFDMPMAIEPDAAANHIAKGLISNSFEIHFPKAFSLIIKTLRIIPNWLYFIIAGKMMNEITKKNQE